MRLLRSLAFLAVAALAAPLHAQQGRATRDAEVRAVPDGNVVATVQTGTTWHTGAQRGAFRAVTLEGWVDATKLGPARDTFPATIGGTGTLRLRADASLNARILGVFQSGAGIRVVERKGDWARVRRDGWILNTAIAPTSQAAAPVAAAPAPVDDPPQATEQDQPARDGTLRTSGTAAFRTAPGARVIGSLETGTVVEPLARDRGWVRVRVEAWVPDSLLVPADSSYAGALTAADLRLDPEGMRGRTVRWVVQVVGLKIADPLRRALQPDEPYLLAMGPSGENVILYIAVPPGLLDEARRILPLAEITVTARIRNGRSQPTGAPVLDLLSFTKK